MKLASLLLLTLVSISSRSDCLARSCAPGAPVESRAAADSTTTIRASGDVPFTGSLHTLGGATTDSVWAVIALALSPSELTFSASGADYAAAYDVTIDMHGPADATRHIAAHEVVRVGEIVETRALEERVIFQQQLTVSPGVWRLNITVRDPARGLESVSDSRVVIAPVPQRDAFAALAVLDVEPRLSRAAAPELVASPRANAVVGRDSVLEIYVEGYGLLEPLVARVSAYQSGASLGQQGDADRLAAADTVPLIDRGTVATGIARLRVDRLTPGPITLLVEGPPLSRAVTLHAGIALDDALTTTSLDDALSQLRYFVAPDRLRAVRDAKGEARLNAWQHLLDLTDSIASPQHPRLHAYLDRLVEANLRFPEGTVPGWLTGRGMVYATLGAPDSTHDVGLSNDGPTRIAQSATETWYYTRLGASLRFVSDAKHEHWSLDAPSSTIFEQLALVARALPARHP